MPSRFRKKVRKLRGSRTYGWGRVAQHRGSGQRGGFGNAGGHKHKWSKTVVEDKDYFGKKGFRPHRVIPQPKTINLDEMPRILRDVGIKGDSAEKKVKINVTDFGYEKVLGRGKIVKPIIVEAPSFSKTAKEKIESAGGKAIVIQD
nr:uL15 family ribosomal protein [Candidatus Njordarchaeum guaymaensis]